MVSEYKDINNEYIRIKLQEEKMKNKKIKNTQPEDNKTLNEDGLAVVNCGG